MQVHLVGLVLKEPAPASQRDPDETGAVRRLSGGTVGLLETRESTQCSIVNSVHEGKMRKSRLRKTNLCEGDEPTHDRLVLCLDMQ